MNDFLKKSIMSIETLAKLKETGMLNPLTAKMLLSAHVSGDSKKIESLTENSMLASQFLGINSDFKMPDESVTGIINFGFTANNIPVGFNPEQPIEGTHWLISGQSGSGKSTLIKILFTQALMFNKKLED